MNTVEPTQRETAKQIERVYGAFDDEINNEQISSAKRIYIVDDEIESEMSEKEVSDARSFGHKVVLKYTVQALAAEYVDADNVADFDAMTRDEREEMIRTIQPDTPEDEGILARRQAAAVLGSRGGTVSTNAKAAAARENGKRGGRPRKTA